MDKEVCNAHLKDKDTAYLLKIWIINDEEQIKKQLNKFDGDREYYSSKILELQKNSVLYTNDFLSITDYSLRHMDYKRSLDYAEQSIKRFSALRKELYDELVKRGAIGFV